MASKLLQAAQKVDVPEADSDAAGSADTPCLHLRRPHSPQLPSCVLTQPLPSCVLRSRTPAPPLPSCVLTQPLPSFSEPWDEESERGLGLILAFVAAENERLLAQLQVGPDYEQLTPRQQALVYAGLAQGSPVETLLHLARRGTPPCPSHDALPTIPRGLP